MKAGLIISIVALLLLTACMYTEPPVLDEPEPEPLPSSCTFAAGLWCESFAIEDDALSLTIGNGLGRTINISSVAYTERDRDRGCVTTQLGIVENGASIELSFDETCQAYLATPYEIRVRYTIPGSEIASERLITGELYVAPPETERTTTNT